MRSYVILTKECGNHTRLAPSVHTYLLSLVVLNGGRWAKSQKVYQNHDFFILSKTMTSFEVHKLFLMKYD